MLDVTSAGWAATIGLMTRTRAPTPARSAIAAPGARRRLARSGSSLRCSNNSGGWSSSRDRAGAGSSRRAVSAEIFGALTLRSRLPRSRHRRSPGSTPPVLGVVLLALSVLIENVVFGRGGHRERNRRDRAHHVPREPRGTRGGRAVLERARDDAVLIKPRLRPAGDGARWARSGRRCRSARRPSGSRSTSTRRVSGRPG